MMKQILIPIAAFAVTATAASAFGPGMLTNLNLNLTDAQMEALDEARKLHQSGDIDEAKSLLEDAGIDEAVLRELREAGRKQHEAVRDAIESGDYDAFTTVVTDGPLAETITTKEQFERFVEAHKLMKSGDRAGAQAIYDELGLEAGSSIMERDSGPRGRYGESFQMVIDAVEANDYGAFSAAIAETPLADIITTEEAFAEFRQAHAYLQSGDKDQAKVIFNGLGMHAPHGGHGRPGHHEQLNGTGNDQ